MDAAPQVAQLQPPPMDLAQLRQRLELVHPASYLDRLEAICAGLAAPAMVDDATYIAPGSFAACQHAAWAATSLLDAMMADPSGQVGGLGGGSGHGELQPAAFCLCRPPGHHVLPTRPMGFGLVNTVSVVARYALQAYPRSLRRLLLLDWDVHHGNGTEEVFYDCADVLYISTHQQGLWPYTGKLHASGKGAGKGCTINLPLPGGAGHEAMLAAWQQVVEPAALAFQPDLILCSSGYDAHWRDPLAGLQLQSHTYHSLAVRVRALAGRVCQGRCLLLLEGGYHLESLAESVVETFRGLMGEP